MTETRIALTIVCAACVLLAVPVSLLLPFDSAKHGAARDGELEGATEQPGSASFAPEDRDACITEHGLRYREGDAGEGGQCKMSQRRLPAHMDVLPSLDRRHVRDIAFGGTHGLLTMVAITLSGIGCELGPQRIIAIGASNLLANAFSMAFGGYIASSTEQAFGLNQLEQEHREVRDMPQEEIKEMVRLYKSKGIAEKDALVVANILSQYEDFWVGHMLQEELGIHTADLAVSPLRSNFVLFVSFLGIGAIPLLGIIAAVTLGRLFGPNWYRPEFSSMIAMGTSGLTLVLMGVMIGRLSGEGSSVWYNGMLMLLNGCIASGISFWISQLFTGLPARHSRPGLMSCREVQRRPAAGPQPAAARSTGPAEAVARGEDSSEPSVKHADSSESPRVARTDTPRSLRLSSTEQEMPITPWPFFRRRFMHGLFTMWVVLSSLVVVQQLVNRMVWESLRVFLYGWLTCVTTGLGAAPFLVMGHSDVSETWLVASNTVASGMMLASSAGMLGEAHEHCGQLDWQILVGLAAGALFIRLSQKSLGEDDAGMEALCGMVMERRHFRKAILIFTVLFCHSAAEGVAVGVAFDAHCHPRFGLYIAIALAIHNIPEGLAMALVLVPRGIGPLPAAGIAVLTSVPQPLLALWAFRFVDAFQSLLPLGLAFASGAMIYVSVCELLSEALEHLGAYRLVKLTTISFSSMLVVQMALHKATI